MVKKVIDKTVSKEKKIAKKAVQKKEKSKDVTPKGLKAFKNEMEKVKWPNKKTMLKYSLATIIFVVFFGVFFYIIEFVMALIRKGI